MESGILQGIAGKVVLVLSAKVRQNVRNRHLERHLYIMNKTIVISLALLVVLLLIVEFALKGREAETDVQTIFPETNNPEVVLSPATTTNSAEGAPAGSIHNLPVPEAVRVARAKAASQAGVAVGQAVALEVANRQWPNSCLGLAGPEEMCAQVITPGYRIVVSAGGKQFIYRTNMSGSVIRQES